MQKTTNTVIGRIACASLEEVKKLAGLYLDINNQWRLISEEVETMQINSNNHRKANENHMIKLKKYIPIRYYNFLYCATQCGFDLIKTINYCKEKCFDLAENPLYLPDRLEMSYTKIINLSTEKMREFYAKNFDQINKNPELYIC